MNPLQAANYVASPATTQQQAAHFLALHSLCLRKSASTSLIPLQSFARLLLLNSIRQVLYVDETGSVLGGRSE